VQAWVGEDLPITVALAALHERRDDWKLVVHGRSVAQNPGLSAFLREVNTMTKAGRRSEWHRWEPHIHAPGTVREDRYTDQEPPRSFRGGSFFVSGRPVTSVVTTILSTAFQKGSIAPLQPRTATISAGEREEPWKSTVDL
jgi:hypothetical protein